MNEQLKAFNAEAAPQPKPKVYLEDIFNRWWVRTISAAMLKSGKGFRLDSPRRTPRPGAARWYGERRADKPGTSKLSRALLRQGAGR